MFIMAEGSSVPSPDTFPTKYFSCFLSTLGRIIWAVHPGIFPLYGEVWLDGFGSGIQNRR